MTPPGSIAQLAAALSRGPVVATGATDAWIALAAGRLRATGPVIVVVPDDERAQAMAEDLAAFGVAERDVAMLPAVDVAPYAEVSPDAATLRQRLTTLAMLAAGQVPAVIVTSAVGLQRRTVARRELAARTTRLTVGAEVQRDATVAALIAAGWTRVPIVDEPGTVAVRGGVIDLFAPGATRPVRAELFGDTIESLRSFDPMTQRTLAVVDEVVVHPTVETFVSTTGDVRARLRAAGEAQLVPSKIARQLADAVVAGELTVGLEALLPAFHDELESPLAYLPADATWLVVDPDACRRAVDDAWHDARLGFDARTVARAVAYPPADLLVPPDELMAALAAPSRRARRRAGRRAWPGCTIRAADRCGPGCRR